MIMLHHLHVFLKALSRMLFLGKKVCVYIIWNFSWARNKRRKFLSLVAVTVFLGFQCDAGVLSSLMSHCFGYSFRMTVLIVAICRQFWTLFVHAFTQTKFAGFSCLALSHQCQSILLSNLASGFLSFGVCIHLWNLLVCQLSHKVCRIYPSFFSMNLSEGTAPFSRFLRDLQYYTVERVLCLLSHSPSGQLQRLIFYLHRPSECWCSCWEMSLCWKSILWEVVCNTCSRQTGASSETLGVRTVEAKSWRLSRSSCFIFPR